MNTQTLALDVSKASTPKQSITIGQGDHNGTVLSIDVYDNGTALDVSGYTCYINILLPDGDHFYRQSCTSGSATNNVTVTVDEEHAASVVGVTEHAYVTIESGTSVIASTDRFIVRVLQSAMSGEEAESWSSDISEVIEQAREASEQISEMQEQGAEIVETLEENQQTYAANEATRVSNENTRIANESSRIENEGIRIQQEATRQSDLETIHQNESLREQAEYERTVAEEAREDAEAQRAANQTANDDAQAANDLAQVRNDAQQALNNQQATARLSHICSADEYDATTFMPTISDPSEGVIYMVPTGGTSDPYDEWLWTSTTNAWNPMGSTRTTIEPITTSQIDDVVDEAVTSPTGSNVLNLTGLSYFWASIKAWALNVFALVTHTHTKSDITDFAHTHTQSDISDTPITIANGGTGSTTAADAATAITSGQALTPASVAATGAISGSSVSDSEGSLADLRDSVSEYTTLLTVNAVLTTGATYTLSDAHTNYEKLVFIWKHNSTGISYATAFYPTFGGTWGLFSVYSASDVVESYGAFPSVRTMKVSGSTSGTHVYLMSVIGVKCL